MAKEIERKFLVKDDSYKYEAVSKKHIIQGYLSTEIRATIRVRIVDDYAVLTVKGKNDGVVRDEWEYTIPANDAKEMLDRLSTGALIDKVRYIVDYMGKRWEVEAFISPVPGLVVAEIELSSPDERFELPPFIGKEVTGDPAYYNSTIARMAHHK